MEEHKLLFPYAAVFFGYAFEMTCEIHFEAVLEGDNLIIVPLGLTGRSSTDKVYEMDYLLMDFDPTVGDFIISNTVLNQANWDNPEKWWA